MCLCVCSRTQCTGVRTSRRLTSGLRNWRSGACRWGLRGRLLSGALGVVAHVTRDAHTVSRFRHMWLPTGPARLPAVCTARAAPTHVNVPHASCIAHPLQHVVHSSPVINYECNPPTHPPPPPQEAGFTEHRANLTRACWNGPEAGPILRKSAAEALRRKAYKSVRHLCGPTCLFMIQTSSRTRRRSEVISMTTNITPYACRPPSSLAALTAALTMTRSGE